jgi:hypothetical protein
MHSHKGARRALADGGHEGTFHGIQGRFDTPYSSFKRGHEDSNDGTRKGVI